MMSYHWQLNKLFTDYESSPLSQHSGQFYGLLVLRKVCACYL